MESLTLEQAYYIGELIAAFVVIVSVIYLALQVRQNTQVIITTNTHNISSAINSIMDMITNNGEVADIYRRGSVSYNSLDDTEQIRFRTLALHFFRILKEGFVHMQVGTLSGDSWDSFKKPFIDILQLPGIQTVWSARRHWYEKDFQNHVDELIARSESEAIPMPGMTPK